MDSRPEYLDTKEFKSLIKRYADHDYTTGNISRALRTVNCNVPDATNDVLRVLGRYGENAIATVARALDDMAVDPEKFRYFLKALEEYKDLVDGKNYAVADGVSNVFKDVAKETPEKMDYVAGVLRKYVPLFETIEEFAVSDVIKFIGSTAQDKPERVDEVAENFEKYSNLINKFSDFYKHWRTEEPYNNHGSTIAYNTTQYVVNNIGRSAINNPEKLPETTRSMERMHDLIASLDLESACWITIGSFASVSYPCPTEKLDERCAIFENNKDRVMKYKDNCDTLIYLGNVAKDDDPVKFDRVLSAFEQHADVIEKHDKAPICIGGTAVGAPEYLADVADVMRGCDVDGHSESEFATDFAKGVCTHLGYNEDSVEFVRDIFIEGNPHDWGKYFGALKEQGNLFKKLSELKAIPASKLADGIMGIKRCFGAYDSDIFDYFDRRVPLHEIQAMCNLVNGEASEAVKNYMEKTRFAGRLGNKKVSRLLDVADVFAVAKGCGFDLESEPKETPDQCYVTLKTELVDKFKDKHGFDVGFDKLEKLSAYFPYLENEAIGGKIKQVLKGEKPESSLAAVDVVIAAQRKQSIQNVREEMSRLAGIYKGLTGNDFDIKESEDIIYYNGAANRMLRQVKEWKRTNADKLDSVKPVLKELEPNLSRIQNIREGRGKEYVVSFAPSDTESQLVALGKVSSCLSPGGCNFRYTAHYLGDMPEGGIFFATVKDSDRIVGRVTVAIGKDEKGKKRVARISRLYPETLKISYKKFDSALSEYGKKVGAELMKFGKLEIGGVNGTAYDDKIPATNVDGNTVVINDTFNPST